ncbi:MAG: hypothetical protein JSS81_06260 [Acidobacteria bacterium]|nr:hypothetical protein [Acidobacteriota bacterium]
MATINFNGKTVSDTEIKNVLQAICDFFEADVNVTSGDRNYVPPGGSPTSMHLKNRAADFHVSGYDDGTVYMYLKVFASAFFASGNNYEVIWHGIHTNTTGPHIHVARLGSTGEWGTVKFMREGTTSSNVGGSKNRDIDLPLIAVPAR